MGQARPGESAAETRASGGAASALVEGRLDLQQQPVTKFVRRLAFIHLVREETPRLCRGGSRSSTFPGVLSWR
jgi:hypothetical protein